MSENILNILQDHFPCASKREAQDCESIEISLSEYTHLLSYLKKELQMDMLMDLTVADWGQEKKLRFTLFCHLFSSVHKRYLRISTHCEGEENPTAPSISHIYPAANWHEREAFDMFGVHFTDHPDLKRILMWDAYPYHPLRKEFPLAGIDAPLPAADVAEQTKASVLPAPMMGGPFCAKNGVCSSKVEPSALDQSWTEKHLKR